MKDSIAKCDWEACETCKFAEDPDTGGCKIADDFHIEYDVDSDTILCDVYEEAI